VRDSRVLILGVAYKPGVADLRESPAIKIMELLAERGCDLCYHDPHIPELARFGLRSSPLTEESLRAADLAVVVTAHPTVDHALVAETAPWVLDFRGVIRRLRARETAAV